MFIVNVLANWQAIVTGGVIAVVILLIEHRLNRNLTWKVLWYVLGGALFVSCFLAWHDEHHNAEVLKGEKSNLTSDRNVLQAKLDDKQHEVDRLRDALAGRPPQVQIAKSVPRVEPHSATVGSLSQGAGSVAQIGGKNNSATVNNFSEPYRHLSSTQKGEIDNLAASLPDDTIQWLKVQTEPDPDAEAYGTEIGNIFKKRGKVKDTEYRLSADSPLPTGVYVAVVQGGPNFQWAQQIANSLNSLGILEPNGFTYATGLKPDEVLILIGVRH